MSLGIFPAGALAPGLFPATYFGGSSGPATPRPRLQIRPDLAYYWMAGGISLPSTPIIILTIRPDLAYYWMASAATPPRLATEVSGPETDQVAYDDIVARCNTLGVFADCRYSTEDQVLFPSAGEYPMCAVVPRAVAQAPEYDDGVMLRIVSYQLVLIVHDEDVEARKATLTTLESKTRNALSGISLGGFTLRAWSRLGASLYPKPRQPESRAVISGQYAYLVEAYDEHDDSETYFY